MAEINQNKEQKIAGGKVRVKKKSTRIDMTPMVDLAFLLLTFFILTSTFNKPNILQLTMPDKGDPEPINERNILNLALSENNKVYWWMGIDAPVAETNFSKNGVRKVLLEQRSANENLMVLIKPGDDSKYENIVDVLDEMNITNMTRYAIVDFTDHDSDIISKYIQSR
ncbi:ExbD/TolR family protein [Chryseosolibacter indicus]|uniref:Biopolymer transporter ExbD n=1 Tax=Chryseosolibacter indicus TaxID=2782351 RepID=A0ABS5VR41_9BACT|nr:biopolymer transporter ExbD [Chryseosolibacter indicus]MBT1703918.1 biopolymer transporter ExbD [Chryseosolibacter indicus]